MNADTETNNTESNTVAGTVDTSVPEDRPIAVVMAVDKTVKGGPIVLIGRRNKYDRNSHGVLAYGCRDERGKWKTYSASFTKVGDLSPSETVEMLGYVSRQFADLHPAVKSKAFAAFSKAVDPVLALERLTPFHHLAFDFYGWCDSREIELDPELRLTATEEECIAEVQKAENAVTDLDALSGERDDIQDWMRDRLQALVREWNGRAKTAKRLAFYDFGSTDDVKKGPSAEARAKRAAKSQRDATLRQNMKSKKGSK